MSGLNKSILVALALRVSLVLALGASVQHSSPRPPLRRRPAEDDAPCRRCCSVSSLSVQSGDMLGYLGPRRRRRQPCARD